jgi:hypothetical protein
MNYLVRKTETVANIAIIVVSLLVGFVTIRSYFFRPGGSPNIPVGTRMALPDVDWGKRDRTLVMVLQKGCSFCTESAPFYQKLGKETRSNDRVGLIAVLPQDVVEGRKYLTDLGVDLPEVKQSTLRSIGVRATPTLALVDRKGVVLQSWLGKLSASKESEVLHALLSAPPLTESKRGPVKTVAENARGVR